MNLAARYAVITAPPAKMSAVDVDINAQRGKYSNEKALSNNRQAN
ncbi:hypothetical protein HMPREF9952_1540 [Haemophilus pittmaniae HK 85]|uniref:Uncharacterized protein n=1 Tax=Haemophilus pittmaniae HK 85 TaxID=1035188 RepID=F9Q781_9PAST|nr:hypothetical protein HMPREF9952_1540 [Haemophilus pittmaniae HK 85]